jgi:cysteine synthase
MLENGFGEHNIQGIGDKHIPLIHNVMATDYVVGVSDRVTDRLNVLFNTDAGHAELARRGRAAEPDRALGSLGLSSICNVVAAIKLARHARLGPDDALVTVATDGAPMYATELERVRRATSPAASTRGGGRGLREAILGAAPDHVLELTELDRRRIFNLGYYTWVEQQGVPIDEFVARRDQATGRDARAAAALGRDDRRVQRRVAGVPVG